MASFTNLFFKNVEKIWKKISLLYDWSESSSWQSWRVDDGSHNAPWMASKFAVGTLPHSSFTKFQIRLIFCLLLYSSQKESIKLGLRPQKLFRSLYQTLYNIFCRHPHYQKNHFASIGRLCKSGTHLLTSSFSFFLPNTGPWNTNLKGRIQRRLNLLSIDAKNYWKIHDD